MKKKIYAVLTLLMVLFTGSQNMYLAKAEFDKNDDSADISMYELIFKATAIGDQSVEWESFKLNMAQAGYLYIESEGQFSADDPENPASYIYGDITTINGFPEVCMIGYNFISGANDRSVEVHILDGNYAYYIEVVKPNYEGFKVPTYQAMEDFLFKGYGC